MPINILMPALSPTMTEGNLARWLKHEGDAVKPGDVIAEIETDKATMEVEAVDEGTLARILVPEGTEGVAVNAPIALLVAEGEDAADLDQMPAADQVPETARTPAEPTEPAAAAKPARVSAGNGAAPIAPPAEAEVPAGTEMVRQTV